MLPSELEALILFDEMQNFNKDLEDFEKYRIFAELQREYEDFLLLKELANDIE